MHTKGPRSPLNAGTKRPYDPPATQTTRSLCTLLPAFAAPVFFLVCRALSLHHAEFLTEVTGAVRDVVATATPERARAPHPR